MEERQLNPIDRTISAVDDFLRGIAAPLPRSARATPADELDEAPLSPEERLHSGRLMRVNHAGEIAAQGLYQGHAAAARSRIIAEHMRAAAEEELDHLSWCEQRLSELGMAPSRLRPLWFAGAWCIGAMSAAVGDRWSLGFVEETERQVAEHLYGHLDRLPAGDARSRAIVSTMRAEEQEHGAKARSAGATVLPRPVRRMMRIAAKVMTGTSYRI